MRKNEDWRLESFEWLPIGEWTVDKLTGPHLENQSMCKICDFYIPTRDAESHIKAHLKEYEKLIKKRKRISAQRKRESLRIARETRKNKKDRDNREKLFQEGELDE
jgi:hypothetical protein